MKHTFLGLGSNIGDRENYLLNAILLINDKFPIINYSSIYITSPMGFKEQPHFLNMAIEINSQRITPYKLLDFVKSIESEIGRKKTIRWGPRIIDIDILLIDDLIIKSDLLNIPHKELLNRKFVLIPLSEITSCISINNEKIFLKDIIKNPVCSTQEVKLYKSKEEIVLNE